MEKKSFLFCFDVLLLLFFNPVTCVVWVLREIKQKLFPFFFSMHAAENT